MIASTLRIAASLGFGLAATAALAPAVAQPAARSAEDKTAEAPKPQQWDSFPTMLLEKIYRGPLRDTIIQRWRDPIDGSVCFIYLPISAPIASQGAQGYAQYGPNGIGSISCVHPTQVLQLWQGGPEPPVPPPATHNGKAPSRR